MASWNFWNTLKTFKTTIDVPEPTADSILTLPSGSQRLAGINDLQPNYRNRIINGAMNVNQINGTTAVTPSIIGVTYISDQWLVNTTVASKLTFQQVVDAPIGFKYSTKVTVASQYAPLSTDIIVLQQRVEGQNITDFALGTAGAVTLNTSNYIKGSVAGVYNVVVSNGTGNRTYIGTISVTTSWTKVSITLVGDTIGTWATDTTIGLSWNLVLGTGSNYVGTANIWQGGGFSTAGSVTFVNQVAGSTLNITGVQLEKVPTGATQGTDYEWLSIEEEERRCARYLPVFNSKSVADWICTSASSSTTTAYIDYPFEVNPRIPPTGITISLASHFSLNNGGANYAVSALVFSSSSTKMAILIATSTGLTAFTPYRFYASNISGKILFTGAQL